MRTLVLDQGYQPHRIVTWQKAVTMLFGGKVEVVEEYDEEIRSVSLTIRMPAVVRLVRRLRRRKRALRFSRFNVMVRDGFTCQYCGEQHPGRRLTMDHVVPRSRGGATSWTNVVTACQSCNHDKGAKTPKEARLTLRRAPTKPAWLPMEAFHVRMTDVPATWKNWLFWNASLGDAR